MTRWVAGRAAASLLCAVGLFAASAPPALGDGDPASDYLLSNQVFLTSQSPGFTPAQRELLAVVRAANSRGFAIRVALISNPYDLGSVTELWAKPRTYVRFLGVELSSIYRQRLVVVMPNGVGFNWPGHPTAPAYRLLEGVRIRPPGDGLAAAAQAAVRRLAAADGVSIGPPRLAPGGASGPSRADLPLIIGAALGALAVLGALAALVIRPRLRRRPRRRETTPAQGRRPVRLRWAAPGVGVVCASAVVAPMFALGHSTPSRPAPSRPHATVVSMVTPPAFSWPAGQRLAPDFVLRDQNDRPVSLSAFRGRPVILTFIDPLCRNLCPLEAQVLNQLERQLPASQRPVIVAVSVDVYANARKYLLQDIREWHLVPQWLWAVGPAAKLASVWNRYKIDVKVTTWRIAGTTAHRISHTEAAYVLDATGHERAVFAWPFYPQNVARVLRQLS